MVSSGVKGCRQNRHKNKRIIVEIVRLFLCLFFVFANSKKTDNQMKMRRNTTMINLKELKQNLNRFAEQQAQRAEE